MIINMLVHKAVNKCPVLNSLRTKKNPPCFCLHRCAPHTPGWAHEAIQPGHFFINKKSPGKCNLPGKGGYFQTFLLSQRLWGFAVVFTLQGIHQKKDTEIIPCCCSASPSPPAPLLQLSTSPGLYLLCVPLDGTFKIQEST